MGVSMPVSRLNMADRYKSVIIFFTKQGDYHQGKELVASLGYGLSNSRSPEI
jgi:hypothetical protein